MRPSRVCAEGYRAFVEKSDFDLVVVWQIEYIAHQLAGLPNVVFVPMHDGSRHLPPEFWRQLMGMKVLPFSIPTFESAQAAGCDARYYQYWPELTTPRPEKEAEGRSIGIVEMKYRCIVWCKSALRIRSRACRCCTGPIQMYRPRRQNIDSGPKFRYPSNKWSGNATDHLNWRTLVAQSISSRVAVLKE